MRTTRVIAAFTVSLISAGVSLVFASGVEAHTLHIASSPTTGSTVSDVSVVSFTFREPIIPEYTEIAVRTSTGKTVDTSAPMADDIAMTIWVNISAGSLPNGKYLASYFIVGTDSQPIESRINFTVTGSPESPETPPDEPAQPDQPVDVAPATADTQPAVVTPDKTAATASTTPTPTAAAKASSTPVDLWLIPAIILVIGTAVGGFLMWRKFTSGTKSTTTKPPTEK